MCCFHMEQRSLVGNAHMLGDPVDDLFEKNVEIGLVAFACITFLAVCFTKESGCEIFKYRKPCRLFNNVSYIHMERKYEYDKGLLLGRNWIRNGNVF